jgi:hypothetical protein
MASDNPIVYHAALIFQHPLRKGRSGPAGDADGICPYPYRREFASVDLEIDACCASMFLCAHFVFAISSIDGLHTDSDQCLLTRTSPFDTTGGSFTTTQSASTPLAGLLTTLSVQTVFAIGPIPTTSKGWHIRRPGGPGDLCTLRCRGLFADVQKVIAHYGWFFYDQSPPGSGLDPMPCSMHGVQRSYALCDRRKIAYTGRFSYDDQFRHMGIMHAPVSPQAAVSHDLHP